MDRTAGIVAVVALGVGLAGLLVGWLLRDPIHRRLVDDDHDPDESDTEFVSDLGVPDTRPDLWRGQALLRYVIDPSATHRRVEKARFVGTERVVRHVSIDIDVPDVPDGVPLGLVDKREQNEIQGSIRDFDIRSAGGTAMSLVSHVDSAKATWQVLCLAVLRSLQALGEVGKLDVVETHPGREPTDEEARRRAAADAWAWEQVRERWPELENELWILVAAPADEAEKNLARMLGTGPPRAGATGSVEVATLLRRLASEHQHVQMLLRRFARSYLLLACLPEPMEAGRRTIVKFALADPAPWPQPPRRLRHALAGQKAEWNDGWGKLGPLRRHGYRLRNWLAWLGWASDSIVLPPLTLLPARALHFEVEVPDGLRLVYAEVSRRHSYGGEPGGERVVDHELDRHPTLAHVFLSDLRLDEDMSAQLMVRPVGIELFLSGLVVGLLTLYLWLARPVFGEDRAGEQDLLLLLPTVVGAYLLVRQHHFVRRVSRGVRLLTLAGLGLAVIAILLIAISTSAGADRPPHESAAFWWAWTCTAGSALLVSLILLPTTLRNSRYLR